MALVKYNNNSISAVTSASSIPSGALTHIKTLTASGSATLSFVHGTDGVVLDSTYPIYKFEFINTNPNSGAGTCTFQFNGSSDGGSNYNVVKTTTTIQATHAENDSYALLRYNASFDLAQSTAFQSFNFGDSSVDADGSISGELNLFNPSSTTFVKHFMTNSNSMAAGGTDNDMVAGYFNTTGAINGIQFKFSAGVIESGKIKLYGIKDS